MKLTPAGAVIFAIGCMMIGFGLVSLLVSGMERASARYAAVEKEQISIKTSYNLTHPEIVGTNESGEAIKRYTIPVNGGRWHYVYEVGGTKTSNVDLGKFGVDVVAEKK